jgi:hypothetical protein
VNARATSAVLPSLHVSGYLFHDGTATIAAVTPQPAASRALPDSGLELVGLDATGRQLASAPLKVNPIHVDREVPPEGLDGVIPAAGVAKVEIVRAGAVLASRAESAHAPIVSIIGVPTGGGRTTTIRWRATDADGDQLLVSIDYSANGGRTYKRIWMGPSANTVHVPSRYLSRSARARIRLTVNDGFRAAVAVSRLFRAPGAPPVATILTPSPGTRQPDDAPLVLSGQAFDDAGTMLRGARLRWLFRGRLLGTGSGIAVTALRPGRDRLELLARDRFGRTGSASVVVVVRAARPLFLVLSAPKRVARGARALRLKVASSLDARLAVRVAARGRRQRFAVSRRLRSLRVSIPAGHNPLSLQLSLSAGGPTRTVTVVVRRR